MKRMAILLTVLIVVSGCAPQYDTEEEVIQDNTEETDEEQRFIVPNNISENEYQTILPYQPSAARGVITNQVSNRYDIDELEQGLIRHAKSTFDPEEYLFQEGQYLTEDMILGWIDDLNPADKNSPDKEYHEENPRVFSHVLEHNYLVRGEENRVELAGITLGIALKSEYAFQTEIGGTTYYTEISMEEMLETGKEVTENLLSRIRDIEELQEVPIMVALYRENKTNAITPGNYVAKAEVEPLEQTVNEWETINENYVLFPSNEAETDYYEQSETMREFSQSVQNYFPNYIGVVGKGFYINDQLQELSINIPIEFYGKQEVIGLTQHLYGLILEHFPNNYDVEVTVESPSKQEALLIREAGEEEPITHIYE
ncbi:CamS family sex pheromone protein [Tenuibacillus multivorans]|uniref:Protein involved in sex pheromone biosynthesis n=1 Tax=Tenuibacillus multivorans TaxID=237069 RepID=A0A1H0E170_9BACI|nr:CamS family sex pheromone protein [Tenuibacillus multivorans]GEL76695.1 putative lipoprotein YerH [Tenuibacillus multivorans]SDN76109.1 Protein involved in sex pheromone biosynthesis [Tenuibacillus multivorans]